MTDPSNTLRKRAWEAGRDAATAGKAETANRRQQGTIYFDDWLDGFESVRWSACTPRNLDAEVVARDTLGTDVQELIEAAHGTLTAMDKYNEANGTYLGGAPLFRLARAVGSFERSGTPCVTLRLSDVNAMLRALDALQKIAAYERGGEISPGPTGDRDDMIGLAREALT